jgi:hypothetical protein
MGLEGGACRAEDVHSNDLQRRLGLERERGIFSGVSTH